MHYHSNRSRDEQLDSDYMLNVHSTSSKITKKAEKIESEGPSRGEGYQKLQTAKKHEKKEKQPPNSAKTRPKHKMSLHFAHRAWGPQAQKANSTA